MICIQGGGTTSTGQQGGDGWCFDGVVYTLNTVDIHGVCFGISRSCAKGGEGSTGGMPIAENIMPTMTANGANAVVYALEGNGARPSHMGNGFNDSGVMYTLNTIEQHSICYKQQIIIDHSRRHDYQPLEIVPTLEAHMGTGGGNVPLVLMRNETDESISNNNGSIMCEQPSGELHGTGCV